MENDKPLRKAIVFIDGNNVYHNLKTIGITPSTINFHKLVLLVCKHFNSEYKCAFYYNSVPSIKDGEDLYHKHMAFLNKIRSYPNFVVVTRKLQTHSNKERIEEKKRILSQLDFCGKCRPVIEKGCIDCIGSLKKKEKGIDVKLAVDMLNISVFKKECDLCIVITGDADFIPAMDLIKENGCDVVSASLPFGYSNQLKERHGWFILDKELITKKCID